MPRFVTSLAQHLETLEHGSLSNRSLTIGNTPDRPRDVIVVSDAGGLPTSLNDNPVGAPETYAIQLKARRARAEDARDVLLAIQRDLHRAAPIDIGSFTLMVSVALDRPALFTRDDKENWLLVQNYEILARENV